MKIYQSCHSDFVCSKCQKISEKRSSLKFEIRKFRQISYSLFDCDVWYVFKGFPFTLCVLNQLHRSLTQQFSSLQLTVKKKNRKKNLHITV